MRILAIIFLLFPFTGVFSQASGDYILPSGMVIKEEIGIFEVPTPLAREAAEFAGRFLNAASASDFEEFTLALNENQILQLGNQKVSIGMKRVQLLAERLANPFLTYGVLERKNKKTKDHFLYLLIFVDAPSKITHTLEDDPLTSMKMSNKNQMALIKMEKNLRGQWRVSNIQDTSGWIW